MSLDKLDKPLKPLHVTQADGTLEVVNTKTLVKLQQEDITLDKLKILKDKRQRGKNVHWFNHDNGIFIVSFSRLM